MIWLRHIRDAAVFAFAFIALMLWLVILTPPPA